MSDTVEAPPEKPKSKGGVILLAVLTLAGCLGGGALGYLGIWSPDRLIAAQDAAPESPVRKVQFVDLPPIVLTLAGPRPRSLVLTLKIETDATHASDVSYLEPRLLDAFNAFLSDIDPAAFERRGILDIIRNELATRASFVLGPDSFSDILITEFRIQ